MLVTTSFTNLRRNFHRNDFDVSYGLEPNTTTVTLVGDSSPVTALVPTSGVLDATSVGVAPAWTVPGFDDSTWLASAAGPGVGFDFGDDAVINNVPNGTVLPGGLVGSDLTDADQNFTLDGTIFGGGPPNWPSGEEPPRALDNTSATKWLAFEATGSSYGFRFAGGQRHAVNGYTITSANDAANRDPYSWTLSGSNDGVNYTIVDTRSAQTFSTRFQTRLYEFNNSTTYEYYRFDFKTKFGVTGLEADRPSANAIQMAEIELFARGPVDFDPLMNLDVEAAWMPPRTSAYQRVEFNVADPASIVSLMLEMQYDDGFVAYLNGKRVAAVHAPALPNFNTNASAKRDNSVVLVPQSFDLSREPRRAGGRHERIGDSRFEYRRREPGFALPAAARGPAVDRRHADSRLHDRSVARRDQQRRVCRHRRHADVERRSTGFTTHRFNWRLPTRLRMRRLYYTTDGSQPSPTNGTLYTGPINVSATTTVRAQAFLDTYLPSTPVTATYLFINDIVRQNHQATLDQRVSRTVGQHHARLRHGSRRDRQLQCGRQSDGRRPVRRHLCGDDQERFAGDSHAVARDGHRRHVRPQRHLHQLDAQRRCLGAARPRSS